jgi:hypothetical protein
MQAVLWTGRTNAALSHETALDLLELADVNPDGVHVTAPSGARVRRQGGERVVDPDRPSIPASANPIMRPPAAPARRGATKG